MSRQLPFAAQVLKPANFVGRQGEIERIFTEFWKDGAEAVGLVPATHHAVEGVGKTALALEYAERSADRYGGVCWVDARQSALIGDQILRCVRSRENPAKPNSVSEPKDISIALLELARGIAGKPCLLILDDLCDAAVARSLLPGGLVHVLITSQIRFLPPGIVAVEIDVFRTDVAASFLANSGAGSDRESAGRLALQLGYLPLALEQAAAYCRMAGIDAAAYSHIADTWTRQLIIPKADSPAFATTAIALDHVKSISRDAEALLESLAFIAPNGISSSWFDSKALPIGGESSGGGPVCDTIDLLAEWSLLRRVTSPDSGSRIVSVHPLVQRVIRACTDLNSHSGGAIERARSVVSAQLFGAAVVPSHVRAHLLTLAEHTGADFSEFVDPSPADRTSVATRGNTPLCTGRSKASPGGMPEVRQSGIPRRPPFRLIAVVLTMIALSSVAYVYFNSSTGLDELFPVIQKLLTRA